MIKFQSYLAGSAFALLLAAHIAMEFLHAYPANQYLWHVNILFAREARPVLQHIDRLTGGSVPVTILALGTLALLCIASARANMRLLAAANCHIALILFIFLAARSYMRIYPHGLPAHDRLASLGTDLSVVQFGILAFIMVLSAACVVAHVRILQHGFASMRRHKAADAMQKAPSHAPLRTSGDSVFGLPESQAK